MIRYLAPGARLLILAHDSDSAARIADLLDMAGYGAAMVTALGHIGGVNESRDQAMAADWAESRLTPPDFHVIAVACPAQVSGYLQLSPGLADSVFDSDGKLTKAETRAASLARLKPQPRGHLWHPGSCSGAIGIEWNRAAHEARAIGVDNRRTGSMSPAAMPKDLGRLNGRGCALICPQGLMTLLIPMLSLSVAG